MAGSGVKLLITGGAGFLGALLARTLLADFNLGLRSNLDSTGALLEAPLLSCEPRENHESVRQDRLGQGVKQQ